MNRVYILYNRNDIAKKMGKCPATISNAMNQLLEVGLIKRKRQGQGKADMLYVMNFSSGEHKKTVYIQMTVIYQVFKINGQLIEKLLKNR